MNKFAVLFNRGANTADIVNVNMNEIFDSNNPDGWTFQSLGGPYAYCGMELIFDTRKDAEAKAKELLI